MPALHRRNLPNCRPMADGGMRECSAGACPPLGSGWGVAESAVPIRCTKPQLRLFIPWCAGASRHERLVRKHVPDSDPGCALQSTSMPALHRRNVPNCRPMADGGMRECSAGACPPLGSGGAWQNPPCQFAVPNHSSGFSYLGVPAPAGMSDWYESMSRTPIRDVPSNQPRCRLSTGETCRIVDRWPRAE